MMKDKNVKNSCALNVPSFNKVHCILGFSTSEEGKKRGQVKGARHFS